MKRRRGKKNTGEPRLQVPQAEEYTVDEILSEFREKYDDPEALDSAAPDMVPAGPEVVSAAAGPEAAPEEAPDLNDDISFEDLWADLSVRDADDAAAGKTEEAAPDAQPAPDEVTVPDEVPAREETAPEKTDEKDTLNFDLPYSLRDIMRDFRSDGEASPSETSVDWSQYDLKENSAPGESAPAEEPADDRLDFSAGALRWDGENQPDEKPVPEADAPADSNPALNEAPPSGRKVGKVWEDFPDEPSPSEEPFVDNLDYSALFKMFASEPGTGHQSPPGEALPGGADEPDAAGLNSDEILDSIESRAAEPAEAVQTDRKEKAPLLADRNDEMDFRDILREFMLGDQHPIYSGTPGIDGKTAEDARTGEESPAGESAGEYTVPAVRPRRRREYNVKEEFPPEPEDSVSDVSGNADAPSEDRAADRAPDASQPPESVGQNEPAADEAEQEAEESGFRSRLKNILAGRSLRTGHTRRREKALNEPAGYVGYEDYLPSEEQAKAAQAAADSREGAHSAPDEGEPSGSLSETEGGVPRPEPEEDSRLSAEDGPSDDELLDYEADFPSFGQWILNELMNLWIRLNGVGDRQSTATMEDEREDPGPEMNVAAASRYYGSQVTMLRMRFQLGLALLAVLAYITLGFPVSGMLKTAKVASAVCLGLQMTILLLCLDVVTNALMNIFRGRFGADGLALLACVITSFDALVVAVGGFGTPHIPLCLFSSLAMMGILFSSLLSARALRKSTRVPAIGKRAYCVTAEEGVRGGKDITLLKSIRPVTGFVRRSEEAPPDEIFYNRFAALALLAVLLLSLLTGIVKHSMSDFLYILSAMLTCTVPVTALSAFALPFFVGSQRIFSSGAAVAGWSGIHDIGASRNLIVTDRDLFPEDTISIETVRVFADESAERVIAYAGTMIAASGSGLGPCFSELMERNGCRMRQVEDFQWLSGGGLQGHIEGHTVLCGSSDLMQLMNVKIPYRLVDRTTVLLSIDGVLYGIFKVVYTAQPEIRSALQELIASNRHPIFAVRDFNITPDMLHEVFDVATDGYDFPPYGDRFRISEAQPSETSKVSAVICREGLGPLTHLADTGRSMYVAVRLNLLVTILTAVLGTLLVFFRLIGPGLLNAWLPFVLMLLDLIIVTMITVFMRF